MRKFLNKYGFRFPMYSAHYKLLIYENNSVYSSQKAARDFAYKPARRFQDAFDGISMMKKDQAC